LLGEYDTNAQVLQETIYLGDTPVAIVTKEGPAIVVDNTTAGETTTVGTWTASTSIAGYLGPNYLYHNASTGTDSFTWSLSIPTTGSYHVYARWTTSSNRSTAATFTVGSSAAVHENQQNNNGVWVLLGTYSLSSGTTNVKLTTDSSGDVIADAVKAVLTTNDGSSIYYIYPDQVDAPRIVTRPVDNQMIWRWDQTDPFGAAAPNQNPSGLGSFAYNPRFPGQLYDQEDNLYYNYFRNYDPTLGRYVQSDPYGVAGAGPNTYGYVNGNPLMLVDSLGRKEESPARDKACKLIDKGYNPDNDACGCQKDVVNDLCECWKKYGYFFQIGQLGACEQKAYFKKGKCAQDCDGSACSKKGGGNAG
jgi:RHS repeat-associated protein